MLEREATRFWRYSNKKKSKQTKKNHNKSQVSTKNSFIWLQSCNEKQIHWTKTIYCQKVLMNYYKQVEKVQLNEAVCFVSHLIGRIETDHQSPAEQSKACDTIEVEVQSKSRTGWQLLPASWLRTASPPSRAAAWSRPPASRGRASAPRSPSPHGSARLRPDEGSGGGRQVWEKLIPEQQLQAVMEAQRLLVVFASRRRKRWEDERQREKKKRRLERERDRKMVVTIKKKLEKKMFFAAAKYLNSWNFPTI